MFALSWKVRGCKSNIWRTEILGRKLNLLSTPPPPPQCKVFKAFSIWTFWQLRLPTLVCRFRIGVFGFMINTRKLAATETDGYWLIKIVLVCIPLLKPHLILKKLSSMSQLEILNVTISLNTFFFLNFFKVNAQNFIHFGNWFPTD